MEQGNGDRRNLTEVVRRGETLDEVIFRRLNRRNFIAGTVAAAAVGLGHSVTQAKSATPAAMATPIPVASPQAVAGGLGFASITGTSDPGLVAAVGYRVTPFLPWGEPILAGAPVFDPAKQTAAAQAQQAGYNHDFTGFLPLPIGSNASDHGLLVINHEYTNPELMFSGYLTANPGYVEGSEDIPEFLPNPTAELVAIELEAHGTTVVEIARDADGVWSVVSGSPYNRRLTATSPIAISGPAAGHPLLQTATDATGMNSIGTLNNCAGGITPWGTFLSCEENFQQYFGPLSKLAADNPVAAIHARYGIEEEATELLWEQFEARFDVSHDPNGPMSSGS